MSSVGLEMALKKSGVKMLRTNVGDKHVVEAMRKGGYNLGGEQSGHIIHLDHSTTGDGCVAALNVLAVMRSENRKLSELSQLMKEVPQVLVNIRVASKKPLKEISGYAEKLKLMEKRLEGCGRIFIRYSGTEPLLRVLVEGPDKKEINAIAEELSSFLQRQLA